MFFCHQKVFFLITAFILYQLLFAGPIMAKVECPFGRVDDPYPGSCNLYIDSDNNQLCDIGQSSSVVWGGEQKETNISFWYLFVPAAVYLTHWFLSGETDWGKKAGLFTKLGFRYFWNLVLLFLFIPAGIFGLLIGLGIRSPFLTFYHSNLGASFVIIILFHIIYRLSYLLKGFAFLSKKEG
ncbi:MAG: hypothetical protein ABH867_02750 [Patescibacteria group bacterium]|nr:hypothetical protein [Patescibacteria group bacterium]